MRVSSSPRDPSNTRATSWRPGCFEGVVGLSYNGSEFFSRVFLLSLFVGRSTRRALQGGCGVALCRSGPFVVSGGVYFWNWWKCSSSCGSVYMRIDAWLTGSESPERDIDSLLAVGFELSAFLVGCCAVGEYAGQVHGPFTWNLTWL